jgi:hypothetical protein
MCIFQWGMSSNLFYISMISDFEKLIKCAIFNNRFYSNTVEL